MQAIFTALIFDHALRIRFKAETNEKPDAAAASPSESGDGADADTVATSSDAATVVAPPQDAGKDDKKDAEDDEEEKNDNLVGKLNNLVTSDLENITQGRDFLFLGGCYTVCARHRRVFNHHHSLVHPLAGRIVYDILVRDPWVEVSPFLRNRDGWLMSLFVARSLVW